MSGDSPVGLLGRGTEQAVVDRLLSDVRAGHSGALVVRGEAGVGKTALLEHLRERAATDVGVTWIVGVESELELTYAGLHQLCSPWTDALDSLGGTQRSALRVAFGLSNGTPPDPLLVSLATLSLLAQVAEHRPLLCVVDDAQWLDDASGRVLGFVARRLGAEAVAMVFAVRRWRDERPFTGVPELELGGLPDDDARALLSTVVPGRLDVRIHDRIVAETGGNPLALLELPRGMTTAELAGGFGLPTTGGVAAHLEDLYVARLRDLPRPSQQLVLIAAADAVGDADLVRRAAESLGIGEDGFAAAAAAELLELGDEVRFRHPLVRSAVYRSAATSDRRAVHAALAATTDPAKDPLHHAWHKAHATADPDEALAAELERCAGRALALGGLAGAAALHELAANLTPLPNQRVDRLLIAARTNLQTGAFDSALRLLALAESEATDEFPRAQVEVLRGRVAASSAASSEAPLQLLAAARRLESLDLGLARETYLDAWGAALFAGHLASPGGSLVDISRAAGAAPRPAEVTGPFDALLDGLATAVTDGRRAAAPLLQDVVSELLQSDTLVAEWLRWGVVASAAAVMLWDFERWTETSRLQVELARRAGALGPLSIALTGEILLATWRGEVDQATALVAEEDAIKRATGTQIASYGALLLAAYRGRTDEASTLIANTIQQSSARGEGLGVDLGHWTSAILNNGACRYEEALESASPASAESPGLYVSTWMLVERIEAAVRCGRSSEAADALEQLTTTANLGSRDWGLGIEARSRALLADGTDAEELYRGALHHLRRTPIRTELARAHLLYGEWLRRENRRVDARQHLRAAHEMFAAMSADRFAERAQRELSATGETVRKRRDHRPTDLTPQEEHIARLARDGRTNPEIAAELFISARTVEWHLRKVFTKLGIASRRELGEWLA